MPVTTKCDKCGVTMPPVRSESSKMSRSIWFRCTLCGREHMTCHRESALSRAAEYNGFYGHSNDQHSLDADLDNTTGILYSTDLIERNRAIASLSGSAAEHEDMPLTRWDTLSL